jgi:hypothetical protein
MRAAAPAGAAAKLVEKAAMKELTLVSIVSSLVLVCAGLTGCATARQVSSGNTDQCMNVVSHGYPVAGTPLRVKPCDPWRNQQWYFNRDGSITGVGDYCIDVEGTEAAEGSQVIYVPCTGSPSQHWTVSGTQLIGAGGKCMDVSGGPQDTFAPLVMATCNGSPSQQWQLH